MPIFLYLAIWLTAHPGFPTFCHNLLAILNHRFYVKDMKLDRVERIKVSGSPHAIKYITQGHSSTGAIVVASYPNWIEVLSRCSGKMEIIESLWFGGLSGVLKRKILYLDFIDGSNNIYAVMAGIDSVVKLPIRISGCD